MKEMATGGHDANNVQKPTPSLSSPPHWNGADAINLGTEDLESLLKDKVGLCLDRSFWVSVTAAVEALNTGRLVKDSGYCIVFSEKHQCYYLLHRTDKSHDQALAYARELLKLPQENGTIEKPIESTSSVALRAKKSKASTQLTAHRPIHEYAQQMQELFVTPHGVWSSCKNCCQMGLRFLLSDHCHDAEVVLLGRARWSSLNEVVKALNEGTLSAEGGFCFVFSNSSNAYYLVWRSDKENQGLQITRCMQEPSLEDTAGSIIDINVEVPSDLPGPQGPWSSKRCWLIDKSARALEHVLNGDAEVLLLGRARWNSVTAVVNALNSKRLVANGGLCVVFSSSNIAHYLIWREEKEYVRLLMSMQHGSSDPVQKGSVPQIKPKDLMATLGPQQPLNGIAMYTNSNLTSKSVTGSLPHHDVTLTDEYRLMDLQLQTQLCAKLGMGPNAVAVQISQHGGRNLGVWHVKSAAKQLIVKFVAAEFNEGARFLKIADRWPNLRNDPMLAFPLCVMSARRRNGSRACDLIVMHPATGLSLADVIGSLWWSGQKQKLSAVFQQTGACLAEFHRRHNNLQHCDFQPSNVFVDERTNAITFIDLADVGANFADIGDKIVSQGDVQRFEESLCLLSKAYGPQFVEQAQPYFRAGYYGRRPP